MTRQVSYWLVPSEEDRAWFQELIDTLAHAHEAPSFVPHVTIYSGPSGPDDDPLDIIARSTLNVRGLTLHVDTVRYTDQFTKTLFVHFHASPVLCTISDQMRQLSSEPSAYVLNPHLSLLYKHLPEHEKQRLAATIHLPKAEVAFSDVWAIASSGHTLTPEDVQGWQTVCRRPL